MQRWLKRGVKPAIKIYRVGGAIRDKILQIESNDNDYVVVGATPEDMKELGFFSVGKEFPVFIDPKTKEEYALARRERKSGDGYLGFQFDIEDVSLKEDLQRRDLTINAIAEDSNGEIIDPFEGVQDITTRTLRHVSSSFKEDPVRVLRIARFRATLPHNFQIANETKKFVGEMKDSGELQYLQPDRVRMELNKVLEKGDIYTFFQTLRELDILNDIFPSINSFSRVQLLKNRLYFDDLIAILSIDNSLDELSKNLKISKQSLRFANLFSLFYNSLYSDEPKDTALFLNGVRDSRVMSRVLDLGENIYLYFDNESYLTLFKAFKNIGKDVSQSRDIPQKDRKKEIEKRRYILVEEFCRGGGNPPFPQEK